MTVMLPDDTRGLEEPQGWAQSTKRTVIETTNACYVRPISLGTFLNVEIGPNKITEGPFFAQKKKET
jgi:hypothetical protein